MEPIVLLKDVCKSYGENQVLRNVDMQIEPGRFHALMGINGAGKSTLMNVLMSYEHLDSGHAEIFGIPLSQDSGEINAGIGYVSERLHYAVPGPIGSFFKLYAGFWKRWDENVFRGFCDKLRLDLTRNSAQFSRGQKMQLAFAAALATTPRLLILDEITAVLDAHVRNFFMGYLNEYCRRGGTVLMATNLISEVHARADRMILLHQGRVKVDAPMAEVGAGLVKIRKSPGDEHPVFSDPLCVEAGVNSDRSVSYIIPEAWLNKLDPSKLAVDHRQITAEEVFIYHTKGSAKGQG